MDLQSCIEQIDLLFRGVKNTIHSMVHSVKCPSIAVDKTRVADYGKSVRVFEEIVPKSNVHDEDRTGFHF